MAPHCVNTLRILHAVHLRPSPQGQSSLLHTLWTPATTLCVGTLCPLGTIYPLSLRAPSTLWAHPSPCPSAHTAYGTYGYRTPLFPLLVQWHQRLSPVARWQTPDATPSTPYPLTYPHPRQTATLPPLPPLLPPTPPRAESRLTEGNINPKDYGMVTGINKYRVKYLKNLC